MSIELERRKISTSLDLSSLSEADRKRALELSAYFTKPGMEGGHVTIAVHSAMMLASKNKQLSTALDFANVLLDRKQVTAKFKENVSFPSGLSESAFTDTKYRRRRSRHNANVHRATRSRSNTTHMQSSISAVHLLRPFTLARSASATL